MARVEKNREKIEQKIDELIAEIRVGMESDLGDKSAYRELYNSILKAQSKFYG